MLYDCFTLVMGIPIFLHVMTNEQKYQRMT